MQDHAYSVFECVEVGTVKLVHVRNPWGMKEWAGPWGDGTKEWTANPAVAAACKYTVRLPPFCPSVVMVGCVCRVLSLTAASGCNWRTSLRLSTCCTV